MPVRVVLFDLGNVLIRWNPTALLEEIAVRHGLNPATFERDIRAWISDWDKATLGGGVAQVAAERPDYAPALHEFNDRWVETIHGQIDGSVACLESMKKAELRAYAASNWCADAFERVRERFPFFSYFDGMQISGQIGIVKPDPTFWLRMMDVFDFNAEEALFIDDASANIAAAKALGFPSILFESEEKFAADIKKHKLF